MNLLLPILIASNLHLGAQADPAPPRPMDLWKNGEMLNLTIEVPRQSSFISHVVTSKSEPGKGDPSWHLTFVPGDKAPTQFKSRYRILVELKTAKTLRAFRFPDNKDIAVETIGPITFITAAPEGVPLEWFASFEAAEGRSESGKMVRRMTIRKEEEDGFVNVELTLTHNGIEELKVRQKWLPGEKWWREYERYVKGQKDLTARLLNPPVLKKELAAKLKPIDDWNKFVKSHPLGRDVKLNPPLFLAEKDPKLSYLLERLSASTGLRFTVADNLADHDPDLDDLYRKHELVHTYMEIIAKRDLDDGRWEKIEGGYRLEGVSRIARPPVRLAWLWITVGSLLTVALAGGAFVIYRRRGKTPAANLSKAAAQVKSPALKKKPT